MALKASPSSQHQHCTDEAQFFFPWDRLTLDNSNLRKFQNNLVWMSITSTPLNKLTLPDKLFSHILITQQASRKSVISLKGTMTASDYRTKVPFLIVFLMRLPQYIDKFRCPLTQCELRHAIGVLNTFSFFADDAHLDNLRKSTRNISQIIDQSFSNAKRQQVITNYFS